MITTSNTTSAKNADKALFFITKQGCPNCTQVKPIVEKYEQEHSDVLVFTHEATWPSDPLLKEFPQIRVFPGVFCMKSGKVVSATNGIPANDSFDIWFSTLEQKYYNFGVLTRRVAQMESEAKGMKEFHAYLEHSIALEESPAPVETDFALPNETATTAPVEVCESCT